MTFTSTKRSPAGVSGSTIINHKIRVKLDLTCEEYVVADYIYNWQKRNPKEHCPIDNDKEEMFRNIGIRSYEILETLFSLLKKKIVSDIQGFSIYSQLDDETRKKAIANHSELQMTVLPIWTDEFEGKLDKEFDEFWGVYGHVGNKVEANNMFRKARKVATYDHLLVRHQKYVKFLNSEEEKWRGKMNCSSWLNPMYKKFDDKYETKPAPEPEGDGELKFEM